MPILNPLAAIPQGVFSALVNTHLCETGRGSLRSTCKDLKRYVDDVTTTMKIKLHNISDAGVDCLYLQTLLENLASLTSVRVTSEPTITTSALQTQFMLAAGQSLRDRLLHLRFESKQNAASLTPLNLSELAGAPI
jgi:hypothetical protein